MDWTTMRQVLYRHLHQDSSTVPQAVKDDVGIAICEALRFNRKNLYHFNEKRGELATLQDEYAYKLPSDFLGFVGDVYYTPAGSDGSFRYKLKEASTDEVEGYRFAGNDYNSFATSGRPLLYSVDMVGKRLLVAPVCSTSDEKFEFRYLSDLGSPQYRYAGSSWAFYEGESENAISDTSTYTNAWFKEGFDVTMWRALYYLWSSIYGGTEESAAKAQTAMLSHTEARLRLLDEAGKMHSKRVVRKYI